MRIQKDSVNFLGQQHYIGLSYRHLKLNNWMCVEDRFCQIRSHLNLTTFSMQLNLNKLLESYLQNSLSNHFIIHQSCFLLKVLQSNPLNFQWHIEGYNTISTQNNSLFLENTTICKVDIYVTNLLQVFQCLYLPTFDNTVTDVARNIHMQQQHYSVLNVIPLLIKLSKHPHQNWLCGHTNGLLNS